ncbi:Polygalacturonase ADPG1 [Hordeum vulgare]|nr:Polygalacturonase ADPG1 [Hordeum vulgare]
MDVLRRSLTMTETDVRHLHRKNSEALRLTIQLSEREAVKEVAVKAKAARHTKEQDHLLRRLTSMRCSSDEDESDVSTTFGSHDDDDEAPPHVDAYTEEGHNGLDDRKGRDGKEMVISSALPRFVHILSSL